MSWLTHHSRSEDYASQAEILYRHQEFDRAVELYGMAASEEIQALAALAPEKQRTMGITVVSAVSLYYKAQNFPLAKRTAHQWLATELLPNFAIDELEELLQVIRYEESRLKSNIDFTDGQVLVSVSGGEVLYGAAPLELILRKVESISSIFYRTTELLLNRPLRTRGKPDQFVKKYCDPWLLQSPAGSYQFEVRVRKPPPKYKQLALDLEGLENIDLLVDQITKKFLDIVRASTQDPEGELVEIVPQEDYRKAFLKQTRELAPPASGKSFEQMEIKSSNEEIDPLPVILRPETREVIKNVLVKKENYPENPEIRITQLRGTLRGLQLDKDWIEVNIDGKNERIHEAKDEIDDVIGGMVNQQVVVDVIETNDQRKYCFQDIQLEEDL
jgi:hypothetical protein